MQLHTPISRKGGAGGKQMARFEDLGHKNNLRQQLGEELGTH